MSGEPVEVQLALLARDVAHLKAMLTEASVMQGALVRRVDELARVADRGQFGLRIALWLGGGVLAAAAALDHFKQAMNGLFK